MPESTPLSRTVPWDRRTLLAALRARGAIRLAEIAFRRNKRTIWSLTRGGRRLNLHVAFQDASPAVVDDLATVAREAGRRTVRAREAARRLAGWGPLRDRMVRLRGAGGDPSGSQGPCCGSPEQLAHLRRLYRHLNATRFDGDLPDIVPIRLSNRMTRRLGHMAPGDGTGAPWIREIALNVDLMLAGNDALRVDTMLHEMAHAQEYLTHGSFGHGPAWRKIARRVGCEPRACRDAALERRPRGQRTVTRVPPDPLPR